MRPIVIALGGNALLRHNEPMTIEVQEKNIQDAVNHLSFLFSQPFPLLITHGNGPQVGASLLRSEHSVDETYALPLDVCVAQSQGEIGYLIIKAIRSKMTMISQNSQRQVVSILTQVIVNKSDTAFENPSKPIGKYFDEEQAKEFINNKVALKQYSDHEYRRMVPSPAPIEILEAKVIETLLRNNTIVIAGGGGGIPVLSEANGMYQGIEAVIDKDLTSAVLANSVQAETLVILTEVPNVYLNYQQPTQQIISKISAKQLELYFDQGHFGSGDMKPKIQAAVQFLKNGGSKVIITDFEHIERAFAEKAGTIIVK